MRAQRGDHRPRLAFARLAEAGERRRFEDRETDEDPDHDERDARQKRQPPAPGDELRVAHLRAADREDHRRQEQARGYAHLRPAARQTAPPARRVLDGHQHGPAPLAADAEPLRAAQHHEQHRRPHAERLVGREQPDQERRHAHDHQRIHEHRLASEPIAVVAEHDAADRTRDEPDREGAERRQRADERVDVRKEQPVEDQRRGGAVQEEVVPLDRRADEAGQDDRPDRSQVPRFSGRCGSFGGCRGHARFGSGSPRRTDAAGGRATRWP